MTRVLLLKISVYFGMMGGPLQPNQLTNMFKLNKNMSWPKKLEKVLAFLRAWQTPVAQFTAQKIQELKVEILPLSEISQDALVGISEGSPKRYPKTFPPSQKTMVTLLKEYEGLSHDKKIYISNNVCNLKAIAKTLIHEMSHHVSDSNYETPEEIFLDELKAYITQEMAKPKPITRLWIKSIAKFIEENYAVPAPKKIQFPAGPFYPIPKELR